MNEVIKNSGRLSYVRNARNLFMPWLFPLYGLRTRGFVGLIVSAETMRVSFSPSLRVSPERNCNAHSCKISEFSKEKTRPGTSRDFLPFQLDTTKKEGEGKKNRRIVSTHIVRKKKSRLDYKKE